MYANVPSTTDVFHPVTRTGKALLWFWDLIDISENMKRAEQWASERSNGLFSLIHCVIYAALTLICLVLTWFFDLESTVITLSNIGKVIIPTLPINTETPRASLFISILLAITPTLLEIFTPGLAKKNIKFVQIGIIGFAIFDCATDIPRASAFSMGMWPQFELLGWGISSIFYWCYFLIVLLFSTVGFESLTIIFGYTTILFAVKAFRGPNSINMHDVMQRMHRTPAQPVIRMPQAQPPKESNSTIIIE